MSKFLKEHKQNLKKLNKKQLIQQTLNWIDISAHMESQFNDSYDDLMWLYVKQRTELEETQEALRRNRNQLDSYKEFERMYKSSKITNTTLYKSNISYAIENCNYKNMSVWQFIIKKFK